MGGLKIIRTIKSNERYDSYEAELSGQKVFAKKAKDKKTRELIAGLPKNSKIVGRLGSENSIIKFRAPEVYHQEQDWIMTEWIKGASFGHQIDTAPQEVAEVLAKIFMVFDKEVIESKGFRQIFTKGGLASRMEERIPKSLNAEQHAMLYEAKKKFDGLHQSLVPALQDADVKPDHLYIDPKFASSHILLDSEHLSPQWPRFYDLGNNLAKFWIREQKEFSNILLKSFLHKSELSEETIFKPLLATLIVRGISLHWEIDYDEGAELYNIPRAQAMLKDAIAANNLDDLLY